MARSRGSSRSRHPFYRAPSQGRLSAQVEAFVDLSAEWRASTEPLRRLLRARKTRLRRLSSAQRRHLEELLFTYARWRSRVDGAVERAVAALPVEAPRSTPRRRALMAFSLLQRLHATGGDRAAPLETGPVEAGTGLEPGELRALADATAGGRPANDPVAALAEEQAFPEPAARELLSRLGPAEAREAMVALNARAPLVLRARPPLDGPQLQQLLEQEGFDASVHQVVPSAVVLADHVRLERHPLLQRGRAAVQDAASQLAVELLRPEPGHTVLDYCAGGGGKAQAIADALEGQGQLLLLDRDQRRLDRAQRRLGDLGELELVCLRRDGLEPPDPELRDRAHRVLVDAPCSGLGTVRRHPDLKWRYSDAEVAEMAQRQLDLAHHASASLLPGGRLVYATCSLRRRENEEVAAALLERGALRALDISTVLGERAERLGAEGNLLTLWPHRHHCDGFFVALFERPSTDAALRRSSGDSDAAPGADSV